MFFFKSIIDQYNGRYTKTPEYPNGTYAYFITTTSTGEPAYPFIVGPQYYGVVQRENLGPNKITINEPVTNYFIRP